MPTPVIVGLLFSVVFLCAAAHQWYIKDKGAALIFLGGAMMALLISLPLLVIEHEDHSSKPNCNVQHARGEQDGLSTYASVSVAQRAGTERYIF